MSTYRTGGHWRRTIVRVGTQPPDADGRRPDDELVGVMDDPTLAARICELLNIYDTTDGRRSRLGDLIVMHGPYVAGMRVTALLAGVVDLTEINDLREELIELRKAQTDCEDDWGDLSETYPGSGVYE